MCRNGMCVVVGGGGGGCNAVYCVLEDFDIWMSIVY